MDKAFLDITKIRAEQAILVTAIATTNQNIQTNQVQAVQLQKQLKRRSEQLRQLKDIERRVGAL